MKQEPPINITLIQQQKPATGVVYAPTKNCLHIRIYKEGAWKLELTDHV